MSLLIVGSIALDTVETTSARADDAVGGSAFYGAWAAANFTRPHIVGVVGDDFPTGEVKRLERRGADVQGLETIPGGRTFRWGGRYLEDMNQRETLFTELNVFGDFRPKIPASYRRLKNVFLANIDPELQLDVLDQMHQPRLVVADTMNLWIDIKRRALERLIKRIDALLLNDEEARMLADTLSLTRAAEKIRRMGVERLLIKKGEHGCMMFGPEGVFAAPALPLPTVKDPTGAGDTFAGGMMGWLAGRQLTPANWRRAILVGTVLASFCVEDFSIEGLRKLKPEQISRRAEQLRAMTTVRPV